MIARQKIVGDGPVGDAQRCARGIHIPRGTLHELDVFRIVAATDLQMGPSSYLELTARMRPNSPARIVERLAENGTRPLTQQPIPQRLLILELLIVKAHLEASQPVEHNG